MTLHERRSDGASAGSWKRMWKRLPQGLRRGVSMVRQRAAAALRPMRVAAYWRPGLPAGLPIHVAGMFGATSGVGRSARLFTSGLEQAGLPLVRIDAGPTLGSAVELETPLQRDTGQSGLLVSQLNPPELLRWLAGPGASALRGRRHVGYWFWELPTAPPPWRQALRYVDEIWCQSTFTHDALAALCPAGPPVRVLPHAVFTIPRPPPDRHRFGVERTQCAVLAAFDLRSAPARKNPMGALAAFVAACPRPDPERAMLVCKVRSLDADPQIAARLRQAAASRNDIILIETALPDNAMAVLTASVDVVLSLHRAEGFGLVPAEGLWAGRAVVATGWSGVLDFLDADCAELVEYDLVPVSDPTAIYAGGLWAEPSVEDAAARLRLLIDDPDRRQALSHSARVKAEATLGREAWLRRLNALLGSEFV